MFEKIGSNVKVSSPKECLEGRKLRAVVLEVISTKGSKYFLRFNVTARHSVSRTIPFRHQTQKLELHDMSSYKVIDSGSESILFVIRCRSYRLQ